MAQQKNNRAIPELNPLNIKNQTPFESIEGFDTENYTCFGVMPEGKQSIYLKVVFPNGAMALIQYAHFLSPINFNGSNEIKIYTHTLDMAIKGAYLSVLMSFIFRNRLAWIRPSQNDGFTDALMMREGEPDITSIQIQSSAK